MNTSPITSFLAASIAVLLTILGVAACTTTAPVAPTLTQVAIANAVEDAISIGLAPVLSKNPDYRQAATALAATLGTFTGDTITPADLNAVLAKTSLSAADQKAVSGIVSAAWQVFAKRYAERVSASTRPDVKIFLAAVSEGIKAAVTASQS